MVGVPVSVMVGHIAEDYRKKVCGLTVPIAGEHILVSDGRMNIPEFDENLIPLVNGEIFDDPENGKKKYKTGGSDIFIFVCGCRYSCS
ncbi:MAG: hypothetical protein ACLR78_04255 [Roseburia sp.]